MEQPGLELALTWDAGITGGGLTHCATGPALVKYLSRFLASGARMMVP